MADVLDHCEIVRNEQIGRPQFPLQIDQEVDDLASTETSSAETGSSQTISFGRGARARAMPRRCRCPPESS